ncbi:hypothetical protein [Seonamhaeicola aphaedonensis]|uniref:Uncharacterized protein n=1 Tax=Seonamhaeicola aphaedonensis TaxID=1461338 RepID=A0A3D9HH87_9FLAO|nr:hypothetical protein [Seonamhaeicola aphaedonensis]RED48879.1 hypothetical protein DFQ02_103210 [Seonamhaeicola aphaedonensis]
MNRKFLNFITTIILALILSQFLPWWSVMVAAFITSFIFGLKKGSVFCIPFIAIALLWMLHAFWLSTSNDFTLARKIAVLLPLGGNPHTLIFVTGIIGGIAAGVSGIFGKQCSLIINSKK